MSLNCHRVSSKDEYLGLLYIRLTFKAYCLGKNESKSFFFVRKLSWFFLCISIHAIKVNCSDHSGQKETEVASETEPGHIFETIESFFVKRCVCVSSQVPHIAAK